MEFRVVASELRTKAEELRSLNAQFKSEVSNLEAAEGDVSSMWEGEAKNSFHNAFQSDKVQMDNFYNAIEGYVARMEAAAAKYEQTENMNTDIANTRSYK